MSILLLVQVSLAAPAGAARGQDPRTERERVRQRRAEVAARVDALRASDLQVSAALDDLAAQVGAQEARLNDTRRAADAAAAEAALARLRQERAERQIYEMTQAVKAFAVEGYMDPSHSTYLGELLSSRSMNEAARKQAFLEVGTLRGRDVLDELRQAREDLVTQRQAHEAAAAEAAKRRNQVQASLRATTAARDQQAGFAASVEERLNATLSEADSLAALDQSLAAEIARREAALAARVRVVAPRAPAGPRIPPAATGALRTVRGITVAAEIADRLEALMGAAERDGFVLGGSGYRNPSAQVAVRRGNCGSSSYAIYEMPASQCSPPTAKPGSSMHEKGLAVDFTYQGRVISSRSSPAFGWLSRNAGRYGFYNLPAEPWHWSTNGN
jgi:hypothetical protein